MYDVQCFPTFLWTQSWAESIPLQIRKKNHECHDSMVYELLWCGLQAPFVWTIGCSRLQFASIPFMDCHERLMLCTRMACPLILFGETGTCTHASTNQSFVTITIHVQYQRTGWNDIFSQEMRCFFQCQDCESALRQLPPQTWLHLLEVEAYNHVPIRIPMCQLYGSDCVINTTCEQLLFTKHMILKYAVPPACCPHTCVLNWCNACAQSTRECRRRTGAAIIRLRPAILLRRTPWPTQIYAKAIY